MAEEQSAAAPAVPDKDSKSSSSLLPSLRLQSLDELLVGAVLKAGPTGTSGTHARGGCCWSGDGMLTGDRTPQSRATRKRCRCKRLRSTFGGEEVISLSLSPRIGGGD